MSPRWAWPWAGPASRSGWSACWCSRSPGAGRPRDRRVRAARGGRATGIQRATGTGPQPPRSRIATGAGRALRRAGRASRRVIPGHVPAGSRSWIRRRFTHRAACWTFPATSALRNPPDRRGPRARREAHRRPDSPGRRGLRGPRLLAKGSGCLRPAGHPAAHGARTGSRGRGWARRRRGLPTSQGGTRLAPAGVRPPRVAARPSLSSPWRLVRARDPGTRTRPARHRRFASLRGQERPCRLVARSIPGTRRSSVRGSAARSADRRVAPAIAGRVAPALPRRAAPVMPRRAPAALPRRAALVMPRQVAPVMPRRVALATARLADTGRQLQELPSQGAQ